uniref:Uncharacterized protein n=1 Tax=Arion vulgaris TaxID=1028688 RepID=A0A0B6Z6A1_9EUPU
MYNLELFGTHRKEKQRQTKKTHGEESTKINIGTACLLQDTGVSAIRYKL